jgi:hypothetical protein
MTRIDHERPFLRLKDSLEKARKKDLADLDRVSADQVIGAIELGEIIHCPLCDVTVRSSNVLRHASNFHGIGSIKEYAEELERRNELVLASLESRELRKCLKELKEFKIMLDRGEALLGLNDEERELTTQLKSISNVRRREFSIRIRKLQSKIEEIENNSIDKKAFFQKKVRRRKRKQKLKQA